MHVRSMGTTIRSRHTHTVRDHRRCVAKQHAATSRHIRKGHAVHVADLVANQQHGGRVRDSARAGWHKRQCRRLLGHVAGTVANAEESPTPHRLVLAHGCAFG